MPESSECKRIAELLAEKVSSKKLTQIEIISGRYTKKDPAGYSRSEEHTSLKISYL